MSVCESARVSVRVVSRHHAQSMLEKRGEIFVHCGRSLSVSRVGSRGPGSQPRRRAEPAKG